ncbi:MAG: arginase family protein [Actinobacteria bacterium]|nr:MAG: arginase family protein [Actinomycetota bacterium]
MNRKALSIIDAPSDLGLRRTGVSGLPDALRAAGLLEGLEDVRYSGRLSVPPYISLRDPPTGVLNPDGIRAFSLRLAERVASVLDLGRFPLVLGGDCSILLGAMLALRRRGRFGLFFIDGHADFYSPESEPNGEVASMDLAVVTGRDPAVLANLEGRRPLAREEDVVVFGFRDADSAAVYRSPDVRDTAMHVFDLGEVRRLGPAEAARQGVAALEASPLEGYWVHLDADVLNDEVMPAVDYRMPNGLEADEVAEALGTVLASPLVVGMEVTIYNPALDDRERSAARLLARTVTRAFSIAT